MSFDYAQQPNPPGFGAILSNAFAQQMGVPGYRPTTTGEDPQAAAGTPYWQAPGTVGGTMRSQHAKTGAVSGVADYIQLGRLAEYGDWTDVMRNLLQTSTQVATSSQLTQINRERIKAGLPPISPGAPGAGAGAPTPSAAGAFGIGTVAVVGIGALALWALTRKRRANPRRRRNPGSTWGRGRPLPPSVKKAKRKAMRHRKQVRKRKRIAKLQAELRRVRSR